MKPAILFTFHTGAFYLVFYSKIAFNILVFTAAIDWYEERNIYFWARDAKSSNAKVDYLVTSGSAVYPVEVKSGKTGTLKSMRLFLKEHPSCPLGIRFSMQKLSFYDRILSIPLYMVKHWERIVKSVG